MNTTSVRKVIEMQVADENLELREQVAQASGQRDNGEKTL